MTPEQLMYKFLKANSEQEVDDVLSEAGYLADEQANWKPFDQNENNFSGTGNQADDPTAALVEKLINGVNAVLTAQCFKSGIDPEGDQAPKTMLAAVEKFFPEVKAGRIENLTPKEKTKLAENIQLVAVGSKTQPDYLIVDRGEGQSPASFERTFLSLGKSNKLRIPFVQGRFNSGGTGILQFCGTKNYQLIISKRHPSAPVSNADATKGLWGFVLLTTK